MNFIIDPLTKIKHYLFSNNGKQLLKKYIKYVQTGGNMKVDSQSGIFYGINPTGNADASFFNKLGIRSFGPFNANILADFINNPFHVAGNLNLPLFDALNNLDRIYLQNNTGPERDIKDAIETRVRTAQRYDTHDQGHVYWASLLNKIRNFIRAFISYVNFYENNPNYDKQQKIQIRNSMLYAAIETNKNDSLHQLSFEQASTTNAPTELDRMQARQNEQILGIPAPPNYIKVLESLNI
jgi:hypothetical protein